MAFKLNVAKTNTPDGADHEERAPRREVDWAAYEAHIIAAAGTATKPRSKPGVISSIIDLGIQNRDAIEVPYTEEEAKKPGAVEFQQGKNRMLRVPRKPCQQVAILVDIPDILVDRGQFFGDSNPAPLRLMPNGEFGVRVDGVWTPIVAKPYSVSEIKHDDGTWAFSKGNTLHKLADACDLLDEKGYFTKDRIGELQGKVAQFEFRVWMKPGKNGKTYLTEDIKLAGRVPEGVAIPEYDSSLLLGINVNGENDPEQVKQLRKSIKNTIRRANNFEGSDIQKLLEATGGSQGSSGSGAGGSGSPAPREAPTSVQVPSSELAKAAGDDAWSDEDGEAPF